MTDKVTFRSAWLELISTLPVMEQQRLCYAVVLRLFGAPVPEMTERAKVIFHAIEREIQHSEIKRENVRKRWSSGKVCIIQSNVQSTIQSNVQSNIQSNVQSTIHSNILCTIQNPAETAGIEGACAPAPESRPTRVSTPAPAQNINNNININNNNNTREDNRKKKILKKESKEPEFYELFPASLRCPEMLAKWADWISYRKSKKKPVSEFAARRQINMLAGLTLLEALASIEQSIANDYQGLFEPHRRSSSVSDPQPQQGKDYSGI